MLGHKVLGSGLNSLSVIAIAQDIATGLTATGTNQATAYEVTTAKADFTTVASGTGAILSSKGAAGDDQLILNSGVNVLKVYPPSGAKINALATNAAISLAPNTACWFSCFSTTKWTGVLSA
jgi:hypothetical protein